MQYFKKEQSDARFIQSFIFRKSLLNDLEWAFSLFKKLKELGYSNSSLAKLLIPLNQNKKLWDFIEATDGEIISEYWTTMYPHFYGIATDEKIFGLNKLIEYEKFLSAIHMCSHFVEEIPSDTIVIILQTAGREKAKEQVRLDGYEVNRLFETNQALNNYQIKKASSPFML